MHKNHMKREERKLSPQECEVVQALDFYLPPFTLKSLAKAVYATEEQVRGYLSNLGLLDVVSKACVAERRKIHVLARQAYIALARATHEGPQ